MGTDGPPSSRAGNRGLASFVAFLLLFAFALGSGSLMAFAGGGSESVSRGSALPAPAGGKASTSSGGATSVTRSAPTAGTLKTARSTRSDAVAAPAAPPGAGFDGGDVDLDFVAAGPFTYNHDTGVGGNYANRTISKNTGVVESLEGGDFECGDLVVFFTQVVVDSSATAQGDIHIDYAFGAETTGQPGLGFDDIVGVSVNSGDSGNSGLDLDETASLVPGSEQLDTQGYDEVIGTVLVTNLDAGEHLIVRIVVHLGCQVGSNPTGNIQSSVTGAQVVEPEADTISVGNQTIPFKKVEDIAQPGMNVDKTCPASSAIGDTITYSISIQNTGNEQLDITSVVDTVNGHAGVNITASFPSSVAAGATSTATYQYTVVAADPDPLPNSVSVSASGHTSEATLNGSASCETDITHVPGIQVVKECPPSVPFGEDVTFMITVTNTGNEALAQVTVTDALLGGDITADFDFPDPFPAGGEVSHEFTYTPGADEDPVENTVDVSGVGADSGVTATATDTCSTDVISAPAINIVKDGPSLVHVGDTITYSFTVTNPGELELFDVVLSDPICDAGTILPGADVDSSLSGGGEEVWHFTCTHLITDTDPDPIPNTATVTGDTSEGEGGEQVSDTDDHVVDIIHPGISIVKTVDEEVVPIGTTVTFTYVITNTGDTTLYNVSVDDDILGHVGDIAVLEAGASVTLTKDFVVGDEIVTNVGTAAGEDVLGRSVSANDTATVAPISGENPPPNNPPTPFTGSDAGRLGIITMVLFGIGVTVVATTRRRRPKGEAA